MKNNITDKVLEALDKKHIRPRARWGFLVKNYTIWTVGIIALVIGGLTVSVVGYMMVNNDWALYRQVDSGFLKHFLLSLPYLWILSLVALVAIVYYDFKHTKRGYALSLYKVISIVVLISLVLGLVFYGLGFGEVIDRTFSEKLPVYHGLFNPRQKILMSPEKGLLVGKITEVESQTRFMIVDSGRESWLIQAGGAKIASVLTLEEGVMVGMAGKIVETRVFKAEIVKPFLTRGCDQEMAKFGPRSKCNERK